MSTLAVVFYMCAAFCGGIAVAVHPLTRPTNRDLGRDHADGAATLTVIFLMVAVILTWA